MHIDRKTKETSISLSIKQNRSDGISIETPLPFFSHMLESMFFHGDFAAHLVADGDVDVDPHHLIEDCGIVLGQAINQLAEEKYFHIHRFGYAIIPMDDALCEAIIDIGGRSYLSYGINLPQQFAGTFYLPLVREFFLGCTQHAHMNIHLLSRSGENGHHIVEATYKAFGRALSQALGEGHETIPSTKGSV